MKLLNQINFSIYQKLGDYRLGGGNYMKYILMMIVVGIILPFLIKGMLSYQLYGMSIGFISGVVSICLQSYLLIGRSNDINESPIKIILLFIILYLFLAYFHISLLSWIIIILAVCIKKSDKSYFSRYYQIMNPQSLSEIITDVDTQKINSGEVSQYDPVVYNNIDSQGIHQIPTIKYEGNNSKLLGSLVWGVVLGIILILISITVGYYVFYTYFGQTVGTIVAVIAAYLSLIYAYTICKKAILAQSSLLDIDGIGISKKFFYMIILPLFLQIILLVGFILGFGLREGYMISIICAAILFIVSIIHTMLFWSRLGLYGLPLFQLDNPSNMNRLPYFIRNKLIRIENKRSTVLYNIIIPIVIFVVMFILGILAVNGVFG